ncbi:MAG: class 1b ribonucleoside-diphosphate reductase subunit alpha, partial [Erysipelothrix sp.]|nr:class 1b ribonucleoside-diphosphate reductase subunit alpha [Erysipelothrix sp.]
MNTRYGIPSWVVLNNQVVDNEGVIKDLNKDKEAARAYFLEHVNKNTQFFHSLEEKIAYLIDEDYYEKEFLEAYEFSEIQEIYDIAYAKKFRFSSYMGAFKFYNDYALKSRTDGTILERYEDRLSIIALYHGNGDVEKAKNLIKHLINQDFTPATPTLLNTGRKHRGEFVSCFLLEVGDSLAGISKALEQSMLLSKLGGGVSLDLTNLRAKGEAIKKNPGVAKGVVGVTKLLDNAFRYADQMGQRQGAGAAYLNVFHPDLEDFLETKKLNADEDVRAKTLSLGVVVPDLMMELARKGEYMYQFYPHTVYEEYGVPFNEVAIEIEKWYDKLVDNPNVRKVKVDPRQILTLIALIQGESGYPYIMFSGNVNRENPLAGNVKFSNLCTEILQTSVLSEFNDYGERDNDVIGRDISCNLSSGHMGNMINNNSIKETVYAGMDVMNSVSVNTNITGAPAIAKANREMRSVGFGIMGHHGYIAEKFISYGSEENIDLIDVFFHLVNYHSLRHSLETAISTKQMFLGFEDSKYATGEYFDNKGPVYPKTDVVKEIFKDFDIPTEADWADLKAQVMKHGLYNSYRLAVAPNGSSGYVMSATPSLTPIKQLVEERTYGNSKTYFPAPKADEVGFMYETAYVMDKFKLIDVIATAQKHVDQGISFELGITSDITTKDLVRYYLYAYKKGIKTLYYTRTNKMSIE